ncbi:MAG TPA: hypothetical protein VFQ35_02770 [Polyangiaceae bacterium]|nr:hypothetical protein [Polyangiaceae bacterium]
MSLFRRFARIVARRDRRIAFGRERERVRAYVGASNPADDAPAGSDLLDERGLPRDGEAERHFVVGARADDSERLVTLARNEVVASHSITFGATGAGKGVAWLMLLDQELRRMILREELGLPPDTAILILEPKHDIAPAFLALLEDRLRSASPSVRERMLTRLTTFNPLGRYVVPLPLLTPARGVAPELHATALSGLVGRLSGSPFGPKQRPILDVVLLCWILARKVLPEGVELLGNWDRLRVLAQRSPSPVVRGFFEENARVPAGSLDGIRARLLRLVFAPNLRAMFSSHTGLDFDEILTPGNIAVFDNGGDQGDEDLTAFFNGITVLEIGRAIRRRANGAAPLIMLVDEFQRVLLGDGDVAEQTATLLETARSRGAAVHLLTQSPASVSAVSPRLLRSIQTNAAVEILGATDDAAALAGILPVTGRRRRPENAPWEAAPSSPWLSREEEQRALIEATQALPSRHFWVRPKRRLPKAVLTKTLEFHVPRSHGDELARRIEQGRWGRLPEGDGGLRCAPRVTVISEAHAPPRRPRGL